MESIIKNLGIDVGIVLLVLILLVFIFIILTVILIVKMNRLNKKLSGFMTGRDGISLEKNILALYEDNKVLKEHVNNNKRNIKILYNKVEKTYQKMGLVKYDAFTQMGGKLSFSLALLDEKNNGFVINSVHSTDGCYSYTKEIKGGRATLALGKEEEEALQKALGE